MTHQPIDSDDLMSKSQELNWDDPNFSWTKAYVSAGLSRIAYDELPELELGVESSSRASLIPSSSYEAHLDAFRATRRRATLKELHPALYNRAEQIITPDLVILIANLRNVICVSMRGTVLSFVRFTDMFKDVAADLDIRKTEVILDNGENLRFHKGFADAVSKCYDEVVNLLSYFPKTAPLCITGHSLGGAMAAIFRARLITRQDFAKRTISGYTFGTPRYLAASPSPEVHQHYHVFNRFDPIPTIPRIGMGYRDAGISQMIDSTSDDNRVVSSSSVPDPSLSVKKLLSVTQHKVETYIKRIEMLQ